MNVTDDQSSNLAKESSRVLSAVESGSEPIYKPFPTDTLPEVVQAYVEESAAAIDCDPSYVALPLIACMGAAIGTSRMIRLKPGWSEPPVIWAITVGESGTAKSVGFEAGTRFTRRRQKLAWRDHQAIYAEYADELKAWKAMKKSERGDEPEPPPPCEHYLLTDATIEAVMERLATSPRGLVLATDEAASWFGSFNQYKSRGADAAHWLNVFNARGVKIDRKGGTRPTLYIDRAFVGVCGTTQPGTLARLLTDEHRASGLAARLLMAKPPTRPKRWTEREVHQYTIDRMQLMFDRLYGLKPAPSIDGGPEPVQVDLTPDAKAAWIEYVNRLGNAMDNTTGDERAAIAKLEAYAARFALIFHLARLTEGDKETQAIDATDIGNGIRLAEWFAREVTCVYDALSGGSVGVGSLERIESVVERLGGAVRVREVVRSLSSSPNSITTEDCRHLLNELAKQGRGRWEYPRPGPRGGSPSPIFHLLTTPARH